MSKKNETNVACFICSKSKSINIVPHRINSDKIAGLLFTCLSCQKFLLDKNLKIIIEQK